MIRFGAYVKELRENAGWPQRKLAQHLDLDVSVLSKIENENRIPKKKANQIVEIIAMVFEIPLEQVRRIYLSDEITAILEYESDYKEILEVSEEKIDYIRSKKEGNAAERKKRN